MGLGFALVVAACGSGERQVDGQGAGRAADAGALPDGARGDDAPSADGLRAVGDQIVGAGGEPIRLRGVNRSGSEYACAQGWGIFDGPVDDAAIDAIAGWNANAIRIPLNESCWRGHPGLSPEWSGEAYRGAIEELVDRLSARGLVSVLELHWAEPGEGVAMGQRPMPNRDHSPQMWREVAARFAGDAATVVFEPYNEPYPDGNSDTEAAWTCWRDGGSCPGADYQVAGMQELVGAIRGAGADNLILLGGVQYSNSLWRWREFLPEDPAGNLAAAWHIYNFNWYTDAATWSEMVADLGEVPIVATEMGEDDCSGFIDGVADWLDARGQSYLGWVWNTWGEACDSIALIRDYDGTPTTYGARLRARLTGG